MLYHIRNRRETPAEIERKDMGFVGFIEGVKILLLKRKSNKSDLARRLGDSTQNLGLKFKRNTLKDEGLKQITTALNCNFTYIFTDKQTGEEIYRETL